METGGCFFLGVYDAFKMRGGKGKKGRRKVGVVEKERKDTRSM